MGGGITNVMGVLQGLRPVLHAGLIMHIDEGILAWPVLAGGAACAAVGVAIGLKKTDHEQLPRVAVLTSAFFVASFIHVPIPPASAHLLMVGLMGTVLGWAAFPAILVAVLLQTLLLGFGGLTTLGVNTTVMAAPAVACFYLFNALVRTTGSTTRTFALGFGAGAAGVLIAALLLACTLRLSGEEFRHIAQLIVLGHVPVMIVEGLVTGAVVVLLRQVQPRLLETAAPALAVERADRA